MRRAPSGAIGSAFALAGIAFLSASCGSADDQARPGFPRTPRTPIAGAPFPYASPEEVGLSENRVWWFKERLYSRVVARHVVGSEVLVVKDGRIVLHQAMGWADRERLIPLERNAIFLIASLTKPVTGTAALLLAEAGRLGLDDRVAAYLPSFANRRSGEITIRQLLTHRSGFVEGGLPGFLDQPSLRQAVDLAGEAGPDFPPGESFIYSSLNSATLGSLVEETTGEPVERYMAERIFAPLRLVDTHARFSPDAPWATRLASSYRRWAGPWEKYRSNVTEEPVEWFSPGGDLYSTVFDYARLLDGWLDWGRAGDPETDLEDDLAGSPRLLAETTVREALADPLAGDGGAARPRYYGFHWEIYAPPSRAGGLPVFGHRGGSGTLALAFPEQHALVLYFTQSEDNEVIDEVIELALDLFRDPIQPSGN